MLGSASLQAQSNANDRRGEIEAYLREVLPDEQITIDTSEPPYQNRVSYDTLLGKAAGLCVPLRFLNIRWRRGRGMSLVVRFARASRIVSMSLVSTRTTACAPSLKQC